MKERVKKLWLEALRSGEYEQGRGWLVSESRSAEEPDDFCCLGVLTNIYVEETGDERAWDRSDVVLSKAVMDWAGLTDRDPYIGGWKASDLNDGRRKDPTGGRWKRKPLTFRQIANLIEKYL